MRFVATPGGREDVIIGCRFTQASVAFFRLQFDISTRIVESLFVAKKECVHAGLCTPSSPWVASRQSEERDVLTYLGSCIVELIGYMSAMHVITS